MSTDAKRAANSRHNEKLDSIRIMPWKEEGQRIRAAAAAAGESLQGYILRAIRAQMEKEKQ